MAFLDKMVQHCCGDCHNGHGISIRDNALDGSNNLARKNTEEEMRLAIDFNTDLSLPVYGFSDQRKYMNNFRFVPVVESPGAAFIVRYDSPDAPITSSLVQSWPFAAVTVVFVLLSGILFWIVVSETALKSVFLHAYLTLSDLESFIGSTETFMG